MKKILSSTKPCKGLAFFSLFLLCSCAVTPKKRGGEKEQSQKVAMTQEESNELIGPLKQICPEEKARGTLMLGQKRLRFFLHHVLDRELKSWRLGIKAPLLGEKLLILNWGHQIGAKGHGGAEEKGGGDLLDKALSGDHLESFFSGKTLTAQERELLEEAILGFRSFWRFFTEALNPEFALQKACLRQAHEFSGECRYGKKGRKRVSFRRSFEGLSFGLPLKKGREMQVGVGGPGRQALHFSLLTSPQETKRSFSLKIQQLSCVSDV